jgi:rhodanese-related sulfurtransferase
MMGPFVPDVISDPLNLVVALLLGIAFGFVLEQAGFSSSRRLAGVFYGYDFTVLRVFFTAAVTAMIGVLLLGHFGLLDLDLIYVNPTWLAPAIVGGAIMGVGFILGGYCPGTSICAAAIGKVDALFFVGGGMLGVLVFGEFYPLYEHFYESTSVGPIKVFDSLGVSQGVFVFGLIGAAVAAFAITTLIEKRVAGAAAPSQAFSTRKNVAAGMAVLAVGLVLLVMPDRKTELIGRVSDAGYMAGHPVATMDVDELAFRIVDNDPRLKIIDIRTPGAFGRLALPGSQNVALREFFSKDSAALLSLRHVKKVIVGDTETGERAACLLAESLGYENLAALRGGFGAFQATFLGSAAAPPEAGRWAADVAGFREKARGDILQMIANAKTTGVKVPKKQRKIVGGC